MLSWLTRLPVILSAESSLSKPDRKSALSIRRLSHAIRPVTPCSNRHAAGTAAFAPQQKSGCTAAIETCRPRHAKKSLVKGGGVHVRDRGKRTASALRCLRGAHRSILLAPFKIKRASVGEESPKPASTPTGAVFLSYASQDAEAAQRICEVPRASGRYCITAET